MFASPCSLRSTQCAALIALATAAGILRMDLANAASPAPRQATVESAFWASSDDSQPAPGLRFQLAFDAVAPWLALYHLTAQTVAEGSATLSAPLAPIAAGDQAPWPSSHLPRPTARQHSYPFAVGPPASKHSALLRADDTPVSPDSTARWSVSARVGGGVFCFFSARLTRQESPGPELASRLSAPSSALRGEPGALRPFTAAPADFGPPCRIPAAALTPPLNSVS